MQFSIIGLIRRTNANIIRRLLRGQHKCVVDKHILDKLQPRDGQAGQGTASVDEFVIYPLQPNSAWVIVPTNDAIEPTVLAPGINEVADVMGNSIGVKSWQGGYCQRSSGSAFEGY